MNKPRTTAYMLPSDWSKTDQKFSYSLLRNTSQMCHVNCPWLCSGCIAKTRAFLKLIVNQCFEKPHLDWSRTSSFERMRPNGPCALAIEKKVELLRRLLSLRNLCKLREKQSFLCLISLDSNCSRLLDQGWSQRRTLLRYLWSLTF